MVPRLSPSHHFPHCSSCNSSQSLQAPPPSSSCCFLPLPKGLGLCGTAQRAEGESGPHGGGGRGAVGNRSCLRRAEMWAGGEQHHEDTCPCAHLVHHWGEGACTAQLQQWGVSQYSGRGCPEPMQMHGTAAEGSTWRTVWRPMAHLLGPLVA